MKRHQFVIRYGCVRIGATILIGKLDFADELRKPSYDRPDLPTKQAFRRHIRRYGDYSQEIDLRAQTYSRELWAYCLRTIGCLKSPRTF